ADDTRSQTPTAELLAENYAGIPLRFPENAFADNPFRGLIDTSRAAKVLGWRPQHFWRDRVEDKE
ncbi:MAG TPA: NAD(P)-dependent oxidoreductase, partial [Armatimonadota bacterium]|nr:NAD(P)-dependent oxidoreductase [Armatimonadota bacterium]